MMTSNFGSLKKISAAGLTPVAISRGIPRWYTRARELRLAPPREWLKMKDPEFDPLYDQLLRQLRPADIFERWGDRAVLLCWESVGEPCHRRNVAEWLEHHLGIVVPEFGQERERTGWQSSRAYHFWKPRPNPRAGRKQTELPF
jgi:hypothetical protein